VYASSVDVYGKSEHVEPIHESTDLRPEDYYALTKVMCEQMFQAASDACGPTTLLRLPGIYGPTDEGRSVVGTFVRKAIAGQQMEINGDGESTRDFVAVEDVANVVLHFVREPASSCVNVAKGASDSMTKLASIVADALDGTPSISRKKSEEENSSLEFDTALLRRLCPEIAMTSLETGVKEYVNTVSEGRVDRSWKVGNA
jgi:UDP-glucose 4-epimerase